MHHGSGGYQDSRDISSSSCQGRRIQFQRFRLSPPQPPTHPPPLLSMGIGMGGAEEQEDFPCKSSIQSTKAEDCCTVPKATPQRRDTTVVAL